MKKLILLLILPYLALATTGFLPTHQSNSMPVQKSKSLVGRWERTMKDGVWVWNMRANGSFSVSSKGKDFATGQYRAQNGIYDINDANCNVNYHGRYRFSFLAGDSLRFTVVEDTCRARRGGMDGTGWKRLSGAE